MGTIIFIIILFLVSVGIFLLKRIITRAMYDGIRNTVDGAVTRKRNQKYQNNGEQNLADMYQSENQK